MPTDKSDLEDCNAECFWFDRTIMDCGNVALSVATIIQRAIKVERGNHGLVFSVALYHPVRAYRHNFSLLPTASDTPTQPASR